MNMIATLEKEGLKENAGNFNIGDTVRVYVKVVEGDKERLKAQSSLARMVAFAKLLQFVVSALVWALKEHLPFTHQELTTLRLFVRVRYVVPNFTTSVALKANVQKLKKTSNFKIQKRIFGAFFCFA